MGIQTELLVFHILSYTLHMISQHLAGVVGVCTEPWKMWMASHGNNFGRNVGFFDRRAVGRVTIRRAERALRWLSDHWPGDLGRPDDIPRPPPRTGTGKGKAA